MQKTYVDIVVYVTFCARNNRKIFKIPGATEAFSAALQPLCEPFGFEVLHVSTVDSQADLILRLHGACSVQSCVTTIKKATTHALREKIPKLAQVTQIWTKHYLATTKKPTKHIIDTFLAAQNPPKNGGISHD